MQAVGACCTDAADREKQVPYRISDFAGGRLSLRAGKRAAAALLVGSVVVGIAAAEPKPDTRHLGVEAIEVEARPIASFDKSAPEQRRFGKLTWRGGLELSSKSKHFGGWSGLVVDADGRSILAISDAGTWLVAELAYDGDRPAGLVHARIGPLLGRDGKVLARERDRDAEAVTLVSGSLGRGNLLVAFERNHRIGRFEIGPKGLSAPVSYVGLPAEARRMRRNSGFEALAMLRAGPHKGSLVAFSERLEDASGNLIGWLWVQGVPKPLAITDIDGFDISDAAAMKDGSVLVLERRFRWTEGVRVRLRRLPAGELRPGAIIGGEVLLTADLGREIDNMEGLAVHEGPRGETILTMISDDNFNHVLQRTVLLQFSISDEDLASSERR